MFLSYNMEFPKQFTATNTSIYVQLPTLTLHLVEMLSWVLSTSRNYILTWGILFELTPRVDTDIRVYREDFKCV